MTEDDRHHRSDHAAAILDVKGARHVGPAEAETLLAECLSLTRRNLETAFWKAIEELEAIPVAGEHSDLHSGTASLDRDFRTAVTAERGKLFPQFMASYEAAFHERVQGKSRDGRREKKEAPQLALVEDNELGEQVALRKAIRGIHDSVREEKFALDLRLRVVLHEAPVAGIFDNPWDVKYICDALGSTCRALWRANDRWRPIMERCVIVATPYMLTLYRELNAYLKDRNILPLVRVRTRGRTGALQVEPKKADDLFSMLAQQHVSSSRGAMGGAPGPGVVMPLGPGPAFGVHARSIEGFAATDTAQSREAAVMRALSASFAGMQVLPFGSAAYGGGIVAEPAQHFVFAPPAQPAVGAAVLAGPVPVLNHIRPAQPGLMAHVQDPLDQAAIEITAGLIDYILDDAYLTAEAKALLGRLQIPLLKAVLLDRTVLADASHPVRAFVDALAKAMMGLRKDDPRSQAMLDLADRLTRKILNEFHDDLTVFDTAKRELDEQLDPERASFNQRLAEAMPSLLAAERRALAREEALARVSAQMSGWRVPEVVHSFLSNEWLDHLSTIFLAHGADAVEWRREMVLIEDLLWSLDPQAAQNPSRLRQILPKLVRAFSGGQRVELVTEPRRKAMLDSMFALHITAVRAPAHAAGIGSESQFSVAPFAASRLEGDYDQVIAMSRGDWCEFRDPDGRGPVLAKLAWRSPQRTQLLFTHRDGTTACVRTPSALALDFQAGRVAVVVEDIPLCERALRHMYERSGNASH